MSLRVDVTGNQTGFQQTLTSAKKQAQQFAREVNQSWTSGLVGGAIGGLTASLSVGAVKDFIGGVFDRARDIRETAEQFDLSTDAVQRWEKALAKAGIEASTFYRALETLRAKREEFLKDPNKGGEFVALGIHQQALDTNVSDEALIQMALNSGGSRAKLNELLGRRGATLGAAVRRYDPNSEVALSAKDIEDLKNAEQINRQYSSEFKANAAKGFAQWVQLFTHPMQFLSGLFGKSSGQAPAATAPGGSDFASAIAEQAAQTQASRNIERQQAASEKLLNAEQRLEEVRRHGMSTLERRNSVLKEIASLDDRIAHNDYKVLTESGAESQARMDELRARREQLSQELRERPLEAMADSATRLGLPILNPMLFGTGVSLQQESVRLQRSIDGHLARIANKADPHSP